MKKNVPMILIALFGWILYSVTQGDWSIKTLIISTALVYGQDLLGSLLLEFDMKEPLNPDQW